jgi:tetratricopeptide (TPR) repeat protein
MKVVKSLAICILIAGLTFLFSITVSGKVYAQKSADSTYQKGVDYLKQNKVDDAILELTKAIELNPKSDKAYYDRGRAYDAKGEIDKAIEDYTNAINNPSAETIQAACNNRGLDYEKKGELDKALQDYTKGIEGMPNPTFSGFKYFKSVLHRNRAEVYRVKGEFDKAMEDVRSIQALGGDADPAFIEKVRNKDSSGGVNVGSKEKEKYPGSNSEVNLYNSRGYQSFKSGRYDEAIADYNRALAINPDDTLVLANRANAYGSKGKINEAIADFKRILEIDPNDYKVCHDLGLTYADIRDYSSALYYFNKALEINPALENDGQFHNDRGVAYFFLRDYNNCWADVNKAIQLGYRVHPQFLSELKRTSGRGN